jgi:hypothetical protein
MARYRCAGLRLHGIGLGLLEGGFMGLAQVHVDAVTGGASGPPQWMRQERRERSWAPGMS